VFVAVLPESGSRSGSSAGAVNSSLLNGSHDAWRERLRGRVVVVSPHLDDAVMSLGATIAWAVQAGAKLDVLTVFAYIPASVAPAGPWDSSCGFATEGQAATIRREEDRQACRQLGAEPRWLNFGAEPYERRGSEDDIWSAVQTATRDADLVLIPGFPLLHPDHSFLSELLLRKGISGRRTVLYAEQPYVYTHNDTPRGPAIAKALTRLMGAEISWTRVRTERAHRQDKLKAVRFYRSQLRHLGLRNIGLYRMLWREAAQGGEAVAWLA
jgi:LmbE family N-acetylglucosaminyl deacetylase